MDLLDGGLQQQRRMEVEEDLLRPLFIENCGGLLVGERESLTTSSHNMHASEKAECKIVGMEIVMMTSTFLIQKSFCNTNSRALNI